MTSDLPALLSRITAATGQDTALDARIGELLAPMNGAHALPAYTASVDACLDLIRSTLPHWHWHVGHGPRGLLPYASLTKHVPATNVVEGRVEASAPTVPLALLGATVKAHIADGRDGEGR